MTLDPEKIPIIEADIGATLKTIAGAGTGKTSVLVERYLRFVIDERISPERLLALTFTKKAAAEMRNRIFTEAAVRGRPGILRELHNAWIMNFHQFSFRIIKESAALFGVNPGAEVATELDISRVRSHLRRRFEAGTIDGSPDEYDTDVLEPARLHAAFDRWINVIAKARGTLWTPESLLGAVRGDDSPQSRSIVRHVAALWVAYEEELRRRELIDFADMIRIAVRGLHENPSLRERYVGKFDHILVDEFQDTNETQNELLRILSGGDFARVTVVGDDKQSVYRWRDARVQNLREFAGREHFLRTNHRSTQNILDLAHHFIVSDPYFERRADDIQLKAARGASDVPICVFHPPDGSEKSYESEGKALAAWILSVTGRLGEGASPFSCYRSARTSLEFGDIAVLMRKLTASSGLPQYERVLREAGIPYAVSGSGGSLEVRALEGLRDLLRVLAYPDDLQALLGLLEAKPFLLPDAHVKELFNATGGLDSDAILSETTCGALTNGAAREGCSRLRVLLDDLRAKRLVLDLPEFISYALETGPFYYGLFDDGADARLVESVLETLFDLVDRLARRNETSLAAFIEALEVVIAGKILDDGRGSTLPAGRVQIMTIHSAQGLQHPAVAVPGIPPLAARSEGAPLSKRGGLYLSDAKRWARGLTDSETYESERADLEQEERCLLYVAFTRAKDHLFVSSPCPNGVDRGRAESPFGVVLDALKKNAIAHEELREAPDVQRSVVEREPGAGGEKPDEPWKPLVDEWRVERERIGTIGRDLHPARAIEFISWRRLHTFVRCPTMYYYRYIAGMGSLAETEEEAHVLHAGEPDAEELSGEFHLPRDVDRKAFGSFVHRLLFEWMSSDVVRKTPRDEFIGNLARRFGLASSHRSVPARAAREILNAFAESDFASGRNVDGLEVPVEVRMDRLVFRGTIDRVERTEVGCVVVDYKGRTPREEYEYQTRFYAWILAKAGRRVSNEARLCYLTRSIDTVVVDVSPARCDGIERDARRLEEASGTGRFEPTPGSVCDSCAFGGICPHAASRAGASRA